MDATVVSLGVINESKTVPTFRLHFSKWDDKLIRYLQKFIDLKIKTPKFSLVFHEPLKLVHGSPLTKPRSTALPRGLPIMSRLFVNFELLLTPYGTKLRRIVESELMGQSFVP